MKSRAIISALLMSVSLLSVNCFAAGAATWSCRANNQPLTAKYEVSMSGEILEITNKTGESTIFFADEIGQAAPGETFFSVDDSRQPEMQRAEGTVGETKADLELTAREKKKYDIGFLFSGSVFYCVRN